MITRNTDEHVGVLMRRGCIGSSGRGLIVVDAVENVVEGPVTGTVDDDVATRCVGAVVLHYAGDVLGEGEGTSPARLDDRQLRERSVVDHCAKVAGRLGLDQVISALDLDRLGCASDLKFGVAAEILNRDLRGRIFPLLRVEGLCSSR